MKTKNDFTEVRCCCRPEKLLGWVPNVPKGLRHITFYLNPELKEVDRPWDESDKVETLELPVQEYHMRKPFTMDTLRGWAVKAENVGIEVLRRIPGFVERAPYTNEPHQNQRKQK